MTIAFIILVHCCLRENNLKISTKLRIKIVGEMVKNGSSYDASDFLKYGADNFEEDMLDSMRDKIYSSFPDMHALANVVCC